MLPQHLVFEYWCRVKETLQELRTGVDANAVAEAVDRFRKEIEPRVGEVIYNRNPEDVAEIIHSDFEAYSTRQSTPVASK